MGYFDKGVPISPQGEARRLDAMRREAGKDFREESSYFRKTETGAQSQFFDPYFFLQNSYGNLKTADRLYNRDVDPFTLRQVAKTAWIINVCIKHIQDRIKPFLKPSTDRNMRGFVIKKVGEDVRAATKQKDDDKLAVERFLLNTGEDDGTGRDNFMRYSLKMIRDALEIDLCATEIAYTQSGRPYAFFAVDGATIEKVLPDQENPYDIEYVQVIDGVAQAYFPRGSLIVDYQNPRTDIRRAFYGYSPVEQAVDLVTSNINTFKYNAGYFTENKLPRGMLLLSGDASENEVDNMREYIFNTLGGSPANQWHVPVLAAGTSSNGEPNSVKWVNLSGSSRDMEFQQWMDFLTAGVVSIFGCSVDELGLQIGKAQPLFARNAAPQIEDSKSLILGNTLGFLQGYYNRILSVCCPGFEMEFTGYERDDPKAMADLAKAELDAFKTLNEVRQDKGLPKIDADWADKCPANPQLVQMYQAAQGGGEEGMEGGEEGAEPEEDNGEGDEDEELSDEAKAAWAKLGFGKSESDGEDEGASDEDAGEDEADSEDEDVEKSLAGAGGVPFVMVIK